MGFKTWLATRREAANQRRMDAEAEREAKLRVHDFRKFTQGWGHSIGYTPMEDNRLDAYGWGRGLRVGDYVVLTNTKTGGQPWYTVESIQYARDPPDQFFAVLQWMPTVPRYRALQLPPPPGAKRIETDPSLVEGA